MKPLLLSLAFALASLGAAACGAGKSETSSTRSRSSASSASTAASARGAVSGVQPVAQTANAAEPAFAQQKRAPVFELHSKGDDDVDGTESSVGLDPDDGYVTRFGPAARSPDAEAITSLLARYFGALAHEEGSRACSLMFLGLENLVAETYSQISPNQKAGRGMTCDAVLSKVFAGHHRELSEESSRLHVIAVWVHGFSALAVLRFGPKAVRRIAVYREGGVWKVGTLQAVKLG